jgi:hypothetical protein
LVTAVEDIYRNSATRRIVLKFLHIRVGVSVSMVRRLLPQTNYRLIRLSHLILIEI